MNPTVIVKDGGIHIITGPGDRCECGIDRRGNARSCHDIVQDLVQRKIEEYLDGATPTPTTVIDLGEDEVKSPTDDHETPQAP